MQSDSNNELEGEDLDKPTLLGFIVISETSTLKEIKQQLISIASQLTKEDRSYIYRPTSTKMPNNPGLAVGQIANYSFKPTKGWRLSDAIKQAVLVMSKEDEEADKHLFVILDKKTPMFDYEIERGIRANVALDVGKEGVCKIYVCDVGDEKLECKNCHCDKVSPDRIGSYVSSKFKELNLFEIEKEYLRIKEKRVRTNTSRKD